MKKVIRIGLIGAGWSAKNITKAIAEINKSLRESAHQNPNMEYSRIELHAISNHNKEKALELANIYSNLVGSPSSANSQEDERKRQFPLVFENYKDLTNLPEIDFVIISLPHFLLAPVGLEAFKAGKHVLIEKPMATGLNDANKLIQIAKDKNLHLGVYFQNRFNDSTIFAKKIIESGILGKILQVRCELFLKRDPEYFSNSNWRGRKEKEGGGVLINQSIHEIDKIRYLLGDYDLDTVYGFLNTLIHPINVEDNAAFSFKLKSGALGTFQASISVKTPAAPVLRVYGSKMSLELSLADIKLFKSQSISTIKDLINSNSGDLNWLFKYFSEKQDYFYAKFKKPDESMSEFKLLAHKRIISAFINRILDKDENEGVNLPLKNVVLYPDFSENETLAAGEDGLRALEVIFKLYLLNN